MDYNLTRPNFLFSEIGKVAKSVTVLTGTTPFVNENGRKIIKAGTIYPKNDATAIGILLVDADITEGNSKPVAIMVAGHYLSDRLVAAPEATAEAAFLKSGLFGHKSSTTIVPEDGTLA